MEQLHESADTPEEQTTQKKQGETMDFTFLLTLGVSGNFNGEILRIDFKDKSPSEYIVWRVGYRGGWFHTREESAKDQWRKQESGEIEVPGRGKVKYQPWVLGSPTDLPRATT